MIRTQIVISALLISQAIQAQRGVSAINVTTSTLPQVSYNNVKGAGLRGANGTMSSNWDSVGTNFSINFNNGANNVGRISQFTVQGLTANFITWPMNAQIRVRRSSNSYVNSPSNHFNFWARTNSMPAANATNGTFNFSAPEVITPEQAFNSNNINSGYDNIFQNTINNLHAGNIERVDCIVPDGLRPVAYDINNAGAVVFDRGTGDPFKVAAILTLDSNGDPLTYGPLISVGNGNFGPNLLGAAINYAILTHDPIYGNRSRPSTAQSQNIRGVFMTLGDLGIAVNQVFYGYSIFGPDVVTADPNWNNYPTNSNSNNQLDPVNVLSIYKDVNSLLPLKFLFDVIKQNNKPLLHFTIHEMLGYDVVIERSINGYDFTVIGSMEITRTGDYKYLDETSPGGISYYRLRFNKGGAIEYSKVKSVRLESGHSLQISPNPSIDKINITIPPSWINEDLRVVIYNAAGSEISEASYPNSPAIIRMSTQRFRKGTYFLRIEHSKTSESISKQFIQL